MTQIILHIYHFLQQRSFLRYSLLACVVGILFFFASGVKLNEDISGFLPHDKQNDRINFVYKNIGISDKIIIRVSTSAAKTDQQKERLIQAADCFVQQFDSLTSGKGMVRSVTARIDQEKIMQVSQFITRNLPYFLEEKDYRRIDSLLTPDNIHRTLENNKKILISPAGLVLKQNIMADPLHLSTPALLRLRNFQVSDQYVTYNDYIFSRKQADLLIFVSSAFSSSQTDKYEQMVDLLDKSIATATKLFPDCKISYFGAGPVAVTNARQIKNDSLLAVSVSVVLILLLLFWFFKDLKSILLMAVPVVFGALLSLAAMYFIKQTISAIAVGAGSVIFGIAINYSLHFLIHKKHEPDPEKNLREIAGPMIIGSITTVGAFLSLLFISADAMRDFGLFAAFALLGTLIFVLIFLPHFVGSKQKKEPLFFTRISDYRFEKNKYILLTISLLSVVFLFFSYRVSFDTNLNKINYMTAEQRKSFDELSSVSTVGKKSVYYINEASDLNAALKLYEKNRTIIDRLQCSGKVVGVSGIGSFLPSDSMQMIKTNRWNEFWKTRADKVNRLLATQGAALGYTPGSFNLFGQMVKQQFRVQKPAYFDLITADFSKEFLINRDHRSMVVTLLYTHPDASELNRLNTTDSFIFDQSGISKTMVSMLSNDFNTVLFACSVLVLVFLTLSFGRLELGIISFLPMAISWVWILGIMAIFHINFNIVNIILATFIFGLGDDYTIYMMDGLMNEYATRRKLINSYKTAVALSSVTMFIGIGTLVLAKHPAMQSLGVVTVIGMLSVVLVTYVIPPVLFNYLTLRKGKPRLIPVTLKQQFRTVYSFIFFLFGSFWLTIWGYVLLVLQRPTEDRKLKYHQKLCDVARFVTRNLPAIPCKIVNEGNEQFDKPAVIICNHQSHLDLMYVMMLSPKVVILTNEWVWRSPFYGRIIRFAEFLPVANGIENSLERLTSLVERGYSIVVFPEGTRSEDCSIRRFHRGAFYLAEKLKLDLVPVLFHGVGHAFPKSEFLLRKGAVTVQIMNRITPDDSRFGCGYAERARQVRRLYAEKYQQLRSQCETPAYYADLVYHNYIYKGASVARQATKSLNNLRAYAQLISFLPRQGVMLHPNCGQGEFDLLCALHAKKLNIIAYDKDDEKIAIAENCFSRPDNLRFTNAESPDEFDQTPDFIVELFPQNASCHDFCVGRNICYYALMNSEQHTTDGHQVLWKSEKIQIIALNVSSCEK